MVGNFQAKHNLRPRTTCYSFAFSTPSSIFFKLFIFRAYSTGSPFSIYQNDYFDLFLIMILTQVSMSISPVSVRLTKSETAMLSS